jgi:hypothetical protein
MHGNVAAVMAAWQGAGTVYASDAPVVEAMFVSLLLMAVFTVVQVVKTPRQRARTARRQR